MAVGDVEQIADVAGALVRQWGPQSGSGEPTVADAAPDKVVVIAGGETGVNFATSGNGGNFYGDNWQGGHPAAAAFDESDGSYAAGDHGPSTTSNLVVDLGQARTVYGIRLYQNPCRIGAADLSYSTVGTSGPWTLALALSGLSTSVYTNTFTPVAAQYWLLQPTSSMSGDEAVINTMELIGDTPLSLGAIVQTVRVGTGVPSGAPTGTELPLAFDDTAVTGGLYVWNGAAWVQVSVDPMKAEIKVWHG